jgi:NDP-sugar pyrophosphorylase family protein
MKFEEYFLKNNSFILMGDIREGIHPWSILHKISARITALNNDKGNALPDYYKSAFHTSSSAPVSSRGTKKHITALQTVMLDEDIYIEDMEIFIGKGTEIEFGAMIKGPAYISENCQIRHASYLRGGVIAGKGCVIGHCSEIKNSILMDESHAGHFNYVGDSILGHHVNLGAGTKLANLQFRTNKEIDSGLIKEIVIQGNYTENTGEATRTGLTKLGAIIGDYTEVGCNSVTSPASIIGANCWIYPNTSLTKGFYKPNSIIKNPSGNRCEITSRP